MRNVAHILGELGSRCPLANTTKMSAIAAILTRPSTTVKGCSSDKAILLKKNDPPHKTDRIINRNQAIDPMVLVAGVRIETSKNDDTPILPPVG